MANRKKDLTSGWLPCGCHVDSGQIVFCQCHANAQKMAGVLDMIRRYYLETLGIEGNPFVQKIDKLIPRRD